MSEKVTGKGTRDWVISGKMMFGALKKEHLHIMFSGVPSIEYPQGWSGVPKAANINV